MKSANKLVRRSFLLMPLFAATLGIACLHTRTPSVATNTPAPAFSLSDSSGKQVSLAELTTRGPAVIVFYRGYW